MENFIKNSLILSYIYKLLTLCYNEFMESAIYGFFISLGKKLKSYFDFSNIWTYLKGPEILDDIWVNSFAYTEINRLLNGPSIFFRKLYNKHEEIFNHSYAFKFVIMILKRFEIVIGLTLILTFIIPDHRWYNIYGVLFTLVLGILFFIKTITTPSNSIDVKSFDFTFIIFMITIGLATITSLFPKDSINYLIYYLISFITMVIIVSSVNSVEDLNKIIELIVIGTFITTLYGIWQWKIVGIAVDPSLTDVTLNQGMSGRVFSTMGNPNIYGELLVLTLPLFGTIILNTKTWWKKILFVVLLIPVIVILLKTGSRSAWVSFAFSLFIFVFFKNKKLIPFMVLAGVLAIPILPQSIYRRILTIFNPNDSSLSYRRQILEPTIPMLKEYWISGVGLGNEAFNTIYKRYKHYSLETVAHTHNLYLQIWLETGVIAIGSFFWLVFRLLKKSSLAIFSKKNPEVNNILIGSISSIAGLMLMGFADYVWFYNRILFTFWIVIALIFAGIKLVNMEIVEKKPLAK